MKYTLPRFGAIGAAGRAAALCILAAAHHLSVPQCAGPFEPRAEEVRPTRAPLSRSVALRGLLLAPLAGLLLVGATLRDDGFQLPTV